DSCTVMRLTSESQVLAGVFNISDLSILKEIGYSPACPRISLLLLRSAFLRRNLSTGFSRLRQSDGYRLLAAGRFLSRPAALQSSTFPLVHRLLDLLLCLLSVSGHFFSSLC